MSVIEKKVLNNIDTSLISLLFSTSFSAVSGVISVEMRIVDYFLVNRSKLVKNGLICANRGGGGGRVRVTSSQYQ